MSLRIAFLVLSAVSIPSGGCATTSSGGPSGGTATSGECKEAGYGEFPGVKSGDKPPVPKDIETREVAAGKLKFHVGAEVCVGPAGNVISINVTEPSGTPDLDEHVKKTLGTWTFCSYVPARDESGKPRCDTLSFDYEIKQQPASAPASTPSGTPTPGP
jgi:hypothetical protein